MTWKYFTHYWPFVRGIHRFPVDITHKSQNYGAVMSLLIVSLDMLYSRQQSLQWRHHECDSVSNHQPHDCLLNRLFRRRSKKTSNASLAFVMGIHRPPVNSPHKVPVTRKMFPFDDVIMGDLRLNGAHLPSLYIWKSIPGQAKSNSWCTQAEMKWSASW